MTSERTDLHRLVDRIPEELLKGAKARLENISSLYEAASAPHYDKLRQELVALTNRGAVGSGMSTDGEHGIVFGEWKEGEVDVRENYHTFRDFEFRVTEKLWTSTDGNKVHYTYRISTKASQDEQQYEFTNDRG